MGPYKSKNITATATLKTGSGVLKGVVINSHSSGTIKIYDNTSAAGTVKFNTITFAAGERWIPFFKTSFDIGCHVVVGGTADLTFVFK